MAHGTRAVDAPRRHLPVALIRAAFVVVGIVVSGAGVAACAMLSRSAPVLTNPSAVVSASPSGSPVDAAPLTPALVEARLRTLDPGLALVAWSDDRDMGEYPKLVFRAMTTASAGDGPRLNAVLVYPTASAREAAQGDFHDMSVVGPRGAINWDGLVHSEWVGVENVLVEVVMPGGTFGGRYPTPSEETYPGLVRKALAG